MRRRRWGGWRGAVGGAVIAVALLALHGPACAKGSNSPAYQALFIRMNPMVVPFLRPNGEVSRQMSFVFVLELADESVRDAAYQGMPRITDAFMRDLHVLAASPRAAERGIDFVRLKRRLLASALGILGPDVVRDVLIEHAMERFLDSARPLDARLPARSRP
ncbi:MAG: hypothetical protein ACT4P2_03300 [Pseudomonadota bacterium]